MIPARHEEQSEMTSWSGGVRFRLQRCVEPGSEPELFGLDASRPAYCPMSASSNAS